MPADQLAGLFFFDLRALMAAPDRPQAVVKPPDRVPPEAEGLAHRQPPKFSTIAADTGEFAMPLGLLMRRYLRLRRELSLAYSARPWPTERIDRLADRIVATERLIASVGGFGDIALEEPLVDQRPPQAAHLTRRDA